MTKQTDPINKSQANHNTTDGSAKIPPVLIVILVLLNVLLGLSALKHGTDWAQWQHVFWIWVKLFIIIPVGIAIVAIPLKLRDPSFQLKMAYYMGLFVAMLYGAQSLRYLKTL